MSSSCSPNEELSNCSEKLKDICLEDMIISSGSDSSDGVAENGEFSVKHILAHDKFVNLVERCLNKEVAFQPLSLAKNKKLHSTYVFLIHWKGFNKYETTWEPEENLISASWLNHYKAENGLEVTPGKCKKFRREFSAQIRDQTRRCSEYVEIKNAEKAKMYKESKKRQREKIEKSRSLSIEPEANKNVENPRKKRRRTVEPIEKIEPSTSAVKSNNILDVRAGLPHRSFEFHMELRKRKCSSAENLNERWKDKAEIEIMNRAHFKINDCCGENEVQTRKTIISNTTILQSEKEKILIDINQLRAKRFFEIIQEKYIENHLKAIDKIVEAYTLDNYESVQTILKQFPGSWCFLIIQCLITECKTYSTWRAQEMWENRAKKYRKGNDYLFLESDEDVKSEVPFFVEKCSEQHSKCTWLGVFLSCLPEKLRFEEKSGYNIPSSRQMTTDYYFENGPFRDDMFLHCMKLGADCQKLKFLMHGIPLGNSRTTKCGYYIDYVHLACCQGSSLRRIQQFLAAGFDIHSMATNSDTGRMIELTEFIEIFWEECLAKKVESQQEVDKILLNYYEELPKMIKRISEEMRHLTTCEHEKNFTLRSGMTLMIGLSVTYPHILHCNPTQNVSNEGDGQHQVMTCLFFEHGCSFASGIRDELTRNKGEIQCANVLEKCHRKIKENRGRFVLCVYRVKIKVSEQDEKSNEITLPSYEFVKSDDKMIINSASVVLLDRDDTSNSELKMTEMSQLHSPGQRIYAFNKIETEMDALKPGAAQIVIEGEFDEPMDFIVQLLFIDTN